LERATNAGFVDSIQVYSSPLTSYHAKSEGIAIYYYRVKANNIGGDSGWSNVQSVEVRWEREPNESDDTASGPLVTGMEYYGYPETLKDYFYFDSGAGLITVNLTNHHADGAQVSLYYQAAVQGNRKGGCQGPSGCSFSYEGLAGRYYVQVYTASGYNSSAPYTLQVAYP